MNRTVGIIMGCWSILINVLMYLAITLSFWDKTKDKVPSALRSTILVNIILQAADTIAWGFRGDLKQTSFFMTSLLDLTYFVCIPFLALAFNYYIECVIDWYGEKVNHFYGRSVMLIGLGIDLLLAINLVTKWFYFSDAYNQYVRGHLFFLIQILQIMMVVMIICGMISYRKTSAWPIIKWHFYVFAVLMPVIIHQLFTYRISVLGIGFTFAIIVLYSIHLKEQADLLEMQSQKLLFQEEKLREQEEKLRIQEEKLEETQEELVQTRIQILVAQIKPHFIYNTIAMIRNYCYSEPEVAAESLGKFAKFLRGSVSSLNAPTCIPLQEELAMVHAYIYLQEKRFGDRLTYIEEIEIDDIELPALSIQIYVENAVRHGIESNEDGGEVKLHVFKKENEAWITIKDNGAGFDTSKPLDGKIHVGTQNVRERLEKMCNGRVDIMSEVGKGTFVTVRIPYK